MELGERESVRVRGRDRVTCQYDWSTKTVPKLPTMLMMPG